MKKAYECSVCKRSNVKLWRPWGYPEPLVCAKCAEERQTRRKYRECIWRENDDGSFTGTPTGKILTFPKWSVNKKGMIPNCDCPGPFKPQMTDQLLISMAGNFNSFGETFIPAIQYKDETGAFWAYTMVPEKEIEEWESLPN